MELVTIFLILGGVLVGLAMGANNAANCLGTSVGAGVIDYRKALMLVAILALLGAGLQGGHTISKVGKGIVEPALLSDINIITILFVVGILIMILSAFGLPVSTTSVVIGAVAGTGFLLNVHVTWKNVIIIFVAGFLTPFIAAVFSYLIYRIYMRLDLDQKFLWFEKFMGIIVLVSGGFLAYGLGANNIGNAMGLIVERGVMGPVLGGFIGGLALSFGAVGFGKKVIKTVGRDITALDPVMAFTSQFGAGIAVYMLTLLAIPTSTSFAIIGGIAGTGLVKGIATVDKKTLKKILAGWIVTPIVGAVLTIIVLKIVTIFWT